MSQETPNKFVNTFLFEFKKNSLLIPLYEESDDEKYSSIEHYLKNGWLGSAYQNFIDANDVIDACDLKEDVRGIEKTKVLQARRCALGPNFQGLPPWNSSLH